MADKLLSKIIDYNHIFEKGVNFINSVASDHYIDDIAEQNNFQFGELFINDLRTIWYDAYCQYFGNFDIGDLPIHSLINTLEEMKKISFHDKKLNEERDINLNNQILNELQSKIQELSMYYDPSGRPIYDIGTIERMLNGYKDELLKAHGKKARNYLYQKIMNSIELSKF